MSTSTHTPMNDKSLEEWTRAEVQQWLENFEDGAWEPFAECFSRYSGALLAALSKEDFVSIVKRKAGEEAEAVGIALFHTVHQLKAPQQEQLARARAGTPPQHQQPAVTALPKAARTTVAYTGSPLRTATNIDMRRLEERMRGLEERTTEQGRLLREVRNYTLKDRTDRSAPSTFAERYQRLPAKTIVGSAWFPIPEEPPLAHNQGLEQPAQEASLLFPPYPATRRKRNGYPAAGASESKVVQPYWSGRLALFPPELPITLVDTHNKVSYGRRKPDVVGYVTNKPRSIFYIALVGDVKARRTADKEDFDDSEKGHLQSFLEELLFEYQPYRSVANGFLTDGCLIQFFCLRKLPLPNGVEWTESPVLWLHEDGGKWLLGLLQDTAVHGLPQDTKIDGQHPVIMNELLGIGGSAVVYSGKYRGETVVVKRFHSADEIDHLRNEERRLRQVADLVPLVPQLVAGDKEQLVLLLRPVGDHFASRLFHFTPHNIRAGDDRQTTLATADDFCQLVDILEKVHKHHRLVHRDVRLSNFFRCQGTGKVFLNDWGCATEVGAKVRFSGALQYAPAGVLERWRLNRTYEPAFAHDLEMVVKSVFHALSIATFDEIRVEEDVGVIIEFWERHLQPSIWSSMLAAARDEDYETLKKQIRDLLPGSMNAKPMAVQE